jgi:ElaB/YqjD/DUF883 family membrane-anchored ribosome-binding protein
MAQTHSDYAGKAKSTAEDLTTAARQKASEAAQAVSEKTGEMAERIQESTAYAALCKAAREQPLATLAGAIGIGFMAGALWKMSRSQSTSERLAGQVSSYVEPHLRSLRRSLWS